jgi:hypothetical protein
VLPSFILPVITNTKGDTGMYKVIKLILGVALAAVLVGLTVHQINEDEKFQCNAGQVVLVEKDPYTEGYSDIYGVAGKYCTGNRSNAIKHIMEANNISNDGLGDLRVGQLIIVPATK